MNVDWRDAVETYPADPRPWTVLVKKEGCQGAALFIEETLRASVDATDVCTRDAERKFVEPVNCVGTARPLMLETVMEEATSVVGISTGAVRRILLVAEKLILELVSAVIPPIAKSTVPRGGGAIDK